MVEPLRHRQTKEAATDMSGLQPPRHISTLPKRAVQLTSSHGSSTSASGPAGPAVGTSGSGQEQPSPPLGGLRSPNVSSVEPHHLLSSMLPEFPLGKVRVRSSSGDTENVK